MEWVQSESVICPSWDLPNHCPILLSNQDKNQSVPLIKSSMPTRHLLFYASDEHDSTMAVIYDELKHHLIRCVYPYLFSGVTIVSYYSLQAAQLALERLRKESHDLQIEYAKPCLVNKRSNERFFVTIQQIHKLDIKQSNYKDNLQQMGIIDSLSETLISPDCVLINLEYDDERTYDKLYQHYHQAIIKGCYWTVHFADNPNLSCQCDHLKHIPVNKKSWITDDDYYDYDPIEPYLTKSSTTSVSDSSVTTPQMTENKKKKKKGFMLDQTDLDNISQGIDTRTTFMIRNIPNKYTQKMLMDTINTTHANTYDFLYLRIDFQNKCNVGYAFINFTDPKSVISFAKERIGKKWDRFNSDKRCALSFATIQGKTALIKKFKNSQVMFEDIAYQPKLFYSDGPNKGKEQPFPVHSYHRRERKHQRA